ncbi:hypothetical protein TNCV_1623571 [Trichonephila clavipes]|nr:hypothetical protein TNCV_1623571 [Trichonephila clavipes]
MGFKGRDEECAYHHLFGSGASAPFPNKNKIPELLSSSTVSENEERLLSSLHAEVQVDQQANLAKTFHS